MVYDMPYPRTPKKTPPIAQPKVRLLLFQEEQNSVTEEEVRLLSQVRPDPTAPPMPEAARGWLSSSQWACCRSLEQLKSFKNNQISLLQNFDQDSLGWAR